MLADGSTGNEGSEEDKMAEHHKPAAGDVVACLGTEELGFVP